MDDFIQSDAFSSHVNDLLQQHHVPGLSIAVIDRDRVASSAFGYASLPSHLCTPDTLFDIASCSKSLTAAAIALLIEEHPNIKYDSIAHDVFPQGEFVMSSGNHTRQVTIDDMLGHRTGLAPNNDALMGVNATDPDNPQSVTLKLRHLPIAASVRSRYLYNNIMYTVLTYLIECRSGQSFEAFLLDRIFLPLEMGCTHLQPSRTDESRAQGHIWDKHHKRLRATQAKDCPEGQGAGSIISTANDMIKWVGALLHHRGPVTEYVYTDLIRMRSFVNPYPNKKLKKYTSPTFYAAGLDVYWYRGYMIAGHNGVASGFASRFIFMPERGFGLVILANSDVATGVCTMITQLLIEEALEVPERERSQKMLKSSKNRAKPQGSHGVVVRERKDEEDLRAIAGLTRYTADYVHPGYGKLRVQIQNGQLFVDGRDRSTAFTMLLKPSKGSHTRFAAQLYDWYDYVQSDATQGSEIFAPDEEVEALFEFQTNEVALDNTANAIRLGLRLETTIDDMIWFERM